MSEKKEDEAMKELMDLFRFIEEQGGKVVNLGVSQPGGTGTEPDFMPFDRLATAEEVDSLEEDKIPWSPQEKERAAWTE